MTDLFIATVNRLTPALRAGDIEACEKAVCSEMQSLPRSPFHIAIDLAISNDPADAAEHFNRFFLTEARRMRVAAAYTEMNGFDVNPDRWHCDLFAYTSYGGHDETYDWLAHWQSQQFPTYVINGLEDLQAVYASAAFREKTLKDAVYICDLLVVIKFQDFIKKAAAKMKELKFPLLATAHDFDFIAEFGPRSSD